MERVESWTTNKRVPFCFNPAEAWPNEQIKWMPFNYRPERWRVGASGHKPDIICLENLWNEREQLSSGFPPHPYLLSSAAHVRWPWWRENDHTHAPTRAHAHAHARAHKSAVLIWTPLPSSSVALYADEMELILSWSCQFAWPFCAPLLGSHIRLHPRFLSFFWFNSILSSTKCRRNNNNNNAVEIRNLLFEPCNALCVNLPCKLN